MKTISVILQFAMVMLLSVGSVKPLSAQHDDAHSGKPFPLPNIELSLNSGISSGSKNNQEYFTGIGLITHRSLSDRLLWKAGLQFNFFSDRSSLPFICEFYPSPSLNYCPLCWVDACGGPDVPHILRDWKSNIELGAGYKLGRLIMTISVGYGLNRVAGFEYESIDKIPILVSSGTGSVRTLALGLQYRLGGRFSIGATWTEFENTTGDRTATALTGQEKVSQVIEDTNYTTQGVHLKLGYNF